MSNVIQFERRPVQLLWSPSRKVRAAWRLSSQSSVIEFSSAPGMRWSSLQHAAPNPESGPHAERIARIRSSLEKINSLMTQLRAAQESEPAPADAEPRVWRVTSDDFDGYCTDAAYQEMCLQMSSGDFGAHKARQVKLSSVRGPILHFYIDDYKQRIGAGFHPEQADSLSWDEVTKAQVRKWSRS